ncbi:dipeptidase [Maribacter cobaltidurans]|uniref:Peptidase M19 n=1 Tax=Maribacter cobaltidurans TaxID=1178778 RepID=A0A223V628_9FLAO|nr:membrane dipeptidase [Maribacter cobaltidurans]ASV30570.1 peptidase M19 [Maribacter cobaltidurans]GGD79904.1 peptidase [Maribacter cobaltidurans]
MFILDAHLDLSMNAMEWNRDLTWSVESIRASEKGMTDKPDRGKNTVSFDALRKGNIGICVATQIARYVKLGNNLPGWKSAHQAWAQTQGQLAWYRAMEDAGELSQITTKNQFNDHLNRWNEDKVHTPIGYILSLEGADSIINMDYLHKSYEDGLRAIGPAHYGPGTYAFGTDSIGGIGRKGKELLKEIQKLKLILDATHLCDQSFWETMEVYQGPIWASHNNCRKFVNHNRQFSDEQIKELIDRKAVIGMALDAWMMVPNWIRGKSTPESTGVSLEHTIQNIDHICQLSGNALHVGIGTDLDGGFGLEQSPKDIDTIADLQKIPSMLEKRGYTNEDIINIMHGNFVRFLQLHLPD